MSEYLKMYCRFPSTPEEIKYQYHANRLITLRIDDSRYKYQFSEIFDWKNQKTIHEHLKALVIPITDGKDATVLVTGPHDSGKNFLLYGPKGEKSPQEENVGIIINFCETLFDVIKNARMRSCVRISYVLVYEEEIYDLLTESEDKLDYGKDKKTNKYVVYDNVSIPVSSSKDIDMWLKAGAVKKTYLNTTFAEKRSHTIFTVTLASRYKMEDQTDEHYLIGNMTFVKLATDYEWENDDISVTAIDSVTKQYPYVPLRDFSESTLTALLQGAFKGLGYVTIILTLSPTKHNLDVVKSALDSVELYRSLTFDIQKHYVLSKKYYTDFYTSLHNELLKLYNNDSMLSPDVRLTEELFEEMKFRSRYDFTCMFHKYMALRKLQSEMCYVKNQIALIAETCEYINDPKKIVRVTPKNLKRYLKTLDDRIEWGE